MRPAELEALFRSHADAAWRVLRRCGVDALTAEEGLAQVFLAARERPREGPGGSERAFVCGVAVHVARKLRRDRGGERLPAPNHGETEDAAAKRTLLDELLATLDEGLRELLVLADLEGLTEPEVAQALEIPPGKTASLLRRARDELGRSWQGRAVPGTAPDGARRAPGLSGRSG